MSLVSNSSKTKALVYNLSKNQETRKTLAWKTLNGMSKIWNFDMAHGVMVSRSVSSSLYLESILLYGCERAMPETMEHLLNWAYTRMIRAALNTSVLSYHQQSSLWNTSSCIFKDCIRTPPTVLAGHMH